jgi:aspartate racemase
MKTIGLIGGMSWASTVPYYRVINQTVAERLGGLHSAQLLLYSVDFEPIEKLQRDDRWEDAAAILADAARRLERAGADFIVVCTNTMHRVAPQVESAVTIPLLHIADATADRILEARIDTIGLLGTRFTMEQEFYRGRLEKRGLRVITPGREDREVVHRVIYDELCLGRTEEASRGEYLRIAASLADRGAEGVILGCTEIGMLLRDGDLAVPFFDTARIHAEAAALRALSAD